MKKTIIAALFISLLLPSAVRARIMGGPDDKWNYRNLEWMGGINCTNFYLFTEYYNNGLLRRKASLSDHELSYEDRYNKSGFLLNSTRYRDGKRHDFHKTFYPDGTIKTQTEYSNGVLCGWKKKYSPDGTLIEQYEIKNSGKNEEEPLLEDHTPCERNDIYGPPFSSDQQKDFSYFPSQYKDNPPAPDQKLYDIKDLTVQASTRLVCDVKTKKPITGILRTPGTNRGAPALIPYINGKIEGTVTSYYPNGKKQAQIKVNMNATYNQYGKLTLFDPSGQCSFNPPWDWRAPQTVMHLPNDKPTTPEWAKPGPIRIPSLPDWTQARGYGRVIPHECPHKYEKYLLSVPAPRKDHIEVSRPDKESATAKVYNDKGQLEALINYKNGKAHGKLTTYETEEKKHISDNEGTIPLHYTPQTQIIKTNNATVLFEVKPKVNKAKKNKQESQPPKQGPICAEYTYTNGKLNGPSYKDNTIDEYANNILITRTIKKHESIRSYNNQFILPSGGFIKNSKSLRSIAGDYAGMISETPYSAGGLKNGVRKTYTHNKVLIRETPYVAGWKTGVEKEYYPETGNLMRETPYENFTVQGTAKEYYPSGKLYKEIPYSNGAKNGTQTEYYESGKVKHTTEYKEGFKNGREKKFNETGQVQSDKVYKNGMISDAYVHAVEQSFASPWNQQ